MGTFSINNGQITEAISYPLHIKGNFDDILITLKDNVDKLIYPKSIRNALLSLWSSVPFKQTSTYSISSSVDSYIGIDATNPSDRDIKKKIFLGKRSYSGTYSYDGSYDIMKNTQLLDSDIDIFFYNTKPDTISNTITRMSILSGKNTGLYNVAPFIQSEYVSGDTESLSIDFVAKVGNVNFKMSNSYTTSKFLINRIQMPTRIESFQSGLENKTLVWRGSSSSGRVYWEELALPVLNTVGTSSEPLTIYGDPTNLNGYSLELNTTDYTPRAFGGIPMGTTFNNVAISEVLRRIIYPYLGPLCTITTINNYAELGSNPTVILNYTITKRTDSTQPASLINMIPAISPTITADGHITVADSATGQIPNAQLSDMINFTISVTDGTKTATASTFIQPILPYFYGMSSIDIDNSFNPILSTLSLTKLVEEQSDKELYVTATTGQYFYFIYDASYPDLSEIFDGNNNNDIIDFLPSSEIPLILSFSSPQSYWANKSFKIYKKQIITPIGPPNVKYQFRY